MRSAASRGNRLRSDWFFLSRVRPRPTSTLFPYTTLFRSWLQQQVDADGSDLHIKVGSKPRMRVSGRLQDLEDRKSTRLNSSHTVNSYAVFCLKKKTRSCRPLFPAPLTHTTAPDSTAPFSP